MSKRHSVVVVQPVDSCDSPYRLLRYLTGLSVNAFARRIGVSHTYWDNLESGKRTKMPPQEVRSNIAVLTGLAPTTIDYLLAEKHEASSDIYRFILRSLDEYVLKSGLRNAVED